MVWIAYVNAYLHDLATAFFFAGSLIAWWLDKKDPQVFVNHRKFLSRLSLGSFCLLLILGGVRAYFYKPYEWWEALHRHQITILMVKHLFLATLSFIGLIVWYKILFQRRS